MKVALVRGFGSYGKKSRRKSRHGKKLTPAQSAFKRCAQMKKGASKSACWRSLKK